MIRLFTACLLFLLIIPAQAGTQIGSVAIYSDGRVEKLLEKNSDWSLWQDQRKRLYKRSSLPYLPDLSYQKFPDASEGFSHSLLLGKPGHLKPYGDKDVVNFELVKKTARSSSKKYWQCSFHGEGKFKIGKKRYKTMDYRCERWALLKKSGPALQEKVRLEYAPSLGLIVDRKHQDSKGKKERVKLVAVLKPQKATAKRIARTVYKLRNDK